MKVLKKPCGSTNWSAKNRDRSRFRAQNAYAARVEGGLSVEFAIQATGGPIEEEDAGVEAIQEEEPIEEPKEEESPVKEKEPMQDHATQWEAEMSLKARGLASPASWR